MCLSFLMSTQKKPQTKDKEKEKEKDKGKEVGKKTALVRHAACVAELKGLPRASSLSFDPKVAHFFCAVQFSSNPSVQGRYLAVTCDDRSVRLYQYDTLLQADRKCVVLAPDAPRALTSALGTTR